MVEGRGSHTGSGKPSPAFATAALGVMAAAVLAAHFAYTLEPALWWRALISPDPDDIRQMVFHHATMPRFAVALVAGAALAFSGAMFQHVLANPLAEPGTLGVSAGSHLALAIGLLAFPALGPAGKDALALAGAGLATVFVLGLAAKGTNSPLTLMLAGLVTGLACSAAVNVLLLFNHRYLIGLFIWSSGTLQQNGWSVAASLALKTALTMLPAILMVRPLTVLGLEVGRARNLGLSPVLVRFAAAILAAAMAAFVTSAVGVLAFVGMVAPSIARLSNARTLASQLVWSPLIGAALLVLADATVLALTPVAGEIPTGAATAFLGAPLLLAMMRRALQRRFPPPTEHAPLRRPVFRPFAVAAAAFVLALALALLLGRNGAGWNWGDGAALPWRAPRVLAAAGCGTLLAAAGAITQRLLANPMASPELTGVSAGAALGVIAVMLLVPDAGRFFQLIAGGSGALGVIVVMTGMGRRSAFAPERMILVGIALTTVLSAFVSVMLASGDPRLSGLLAWMAGSTYRVSAGDATFSLAAAVGLVAVLPMLARWLDIVPLGDEAAKALGVPLPLCRFVLMLAASIAAATATLIVGPLSFVGLLAPHLARLSGVQRALPQTLMAALVGAAIMILADWIGRQAAFPRQIPAGLMASAVGAPVLLWLLWRAVRRPV